MRMRKRSRRSPVRGHELRNDVFPGRSHSVCEAEIAVLDGMLKALAQGRSPLP